MAYSTQPVYQNPYQTIKIGQTSPYQGQTGTWGLSGSNTGGSTTYYSNAPTIGTGTNKTGSVMNNAPATYGGSAGQAMTTQPVSQSNSGSVVTPPTNGFPSGPSGQTGQQTAYQTAGSQATGGGTQGFTWEVPQWMRGLTAEQWATPTIQQAVANYMAGSLPFTQLQQNSYQYTNDFNESQRRWDQQFGWTQQNDQFNQNLATQQQQLATQVASNQQENWLKQFGLDSQVELGKLSVAQQQNVIDQAYKQGLISNEKYANESTRLYQSGQLANEQYANSTNRWNVTQQRNNELTQIKNQDWYNRAQTNIAQQQATIDKAYKEGQISNQQRDLALQELTQQQLNTYRNAQLSQEGALTREGYANQQAIARMQAFGRTQTPRARWVRSWT